MIEKHRILMLTRFADHAEIRIRTMREFLRRVELDCNDPWVAEFSEHLANLQEIIDDLRKDVQK